jgi:nucleoside-diphosphate-sugar epimerase
VLFIYPSSIAAYGLPSLEAKMQAGAGDRGPVRAADDDVRVQQAVLRAARPLLRDGTTSSCRPTRSGASISGCVRFPGLISAMTLPSGGTSDYAPEMIHAAAKGEPYDCFVRPDTQIPFMAMPDGVDALMSLAAAPRDRLTRSAYNLTAFNPSAAEIRDVVVAAFPDAASRVRPWDTKRQGIIDSWPAAVDDSPRDATGDSTRSTTSTALPRVPHPDNPRALPS